MGASQAACCASERKGEDEASALSERNVEKDRSSRAMCGCLAHDRKGQGSAAAEISSREVDSRGLVAAKLAALEESNRELHEAKLELEARLNVLGDENARLREEVVSVTGVESCNGQLLSTCNDLRDEPPRRTASSTDPFSFPSPRLESGTCRISQAVLDSRDRTSRSLSDARCSRRVVRFDDAADVSPISVLSHTTSLGLERFSADDNSSRRRASSGYSACSEWWEDEGRRVSSVPTWLKFDEPESPCDSSASGGAANSGCLTMDLMSARSSLEEGAGPSSSNGSLGGKQASPKGSSRSTRRGSSNAELSSCGPGDELFSPSSSRSPKTSN